METTTEEPEIPKRSGIEDTKSTSSITQLAVNVMLNLKETILPTCTPGGEPNHTTTREDVTPSTNGATAAAPVDEVEEMEEEKPAALSSNGSENSTATSNLSITKVAADRPKENHAAAMLLKASVAVSNFPTPDDILVKDGLVQQSGAFFKEIVQQTLLEILAPEASHEHRSIAALKIAQQLKDSHPQSRFLQTSPDNGSWMALSEGQAMMAIRSALEHDQIIKKRESTPVIDVNEEARPEDYRLTDVIVINGKIADDTQHGGNQRLIELIRIWGRLYASASYPDKDEVAEKVMDTVTKLSTPPGRFLQPDWETGKWIFYPLSDAKLTVHRALEFSAVQHLVAPYAKPRASPQETSQVYTNGRKAPPMDVARMNALVESALQDSNSEDDPVVEVKREDKKSRRKPKEAPKVAEPPEEDDPYDYSPDAIRSPHSEDVLRGRGGVINQHPGNISFRRDIKKYHVAYSLSSTKNEKNALVNKVLRRVRKRGGRFLYQHPTLSGCWLQSQKEEARRKTSQALREGASDVRRNMGVSSVTLFSKAGAGVDPDTPLSAAPFGEVDATESEQADIPAGPESTPSQNWKPRPMAEPRQPATVPYVVDGKETWDPMVSNGGVSPRPNDVLSARGGRVNAHPGNCRFRQLIYDNKVAYSLATTEAEKAGLIGQVIEGVRAQDPPGRFLFRDYEEGNWVEAPEERWIRKTSQALREGAPKIRLAYGGDASKIRVKRTTKRRIETLADLKEFADSPQETPNGKKPRKTVAAKSPGMIEAAEVLGDLGQFNSSE